MNEQLLDDLSGQRVSRLGAGIDRRGIQSAGARTFEELQRTAIRGDGADLGVLMGPRRG